MDETVILRFRVREPASHRNGPERGAVLRSSLRTIGELMITAGLVLLLFAAYEIWGKSAIIGGHQRDLDSQLAQEWGQPGPPTVGPTGPGSGSGSLGAPPGGSIARLYIPRLGKHWVVVEGVAPGDIRYAPGHYPGTAMPGQVGNFSVAGHRTPAIFWDLDEMRSGDVIVVQTRSLYYRYIVSGVEIVAPTAVQVVAPVPDHPGDTPSVAMLTLTTCNPKWDNYQRLIVHAALDPDHPTSRTPPAEIQGS